MASGVLAHSLWTAQLTFCDAADDHRHVSLGIHIRCEGSMTTGTNLDVVRVALQARMQDSVAHQTSPGTQSTLTSAKSFSMLPVHELCPAALLCIY